MPAANYRLEHQPLGRKSTAFGGAPESIPSDIPSSETSVARSQGGHFPSDDFVQPSTESPMQPALPGDNIELTDTQPGWACLWRVWVLFLPRRSVEGRFVWGRVWRRHDGRRWRYTNFAKVGRP